MVISCRAAGHLWRLAAIAPRFYSADAVNSLSDCSKNILPCENATRSPDKPPAVRSRFQYDNEVNQSAEDLGSKLPTTVCEEEDLDNTRDIKVTLCGCNGRVGRVVALLLKQSNFISELHLHDVTAVPTSITDISRIDTACDVSVFAGEDSLKTSLVEADIVVMTAGVSRTLGLAKIDLFRKNADIVAHITEASCEMCPQALFVVVTNPINSLVPIVSNILEHHHCYDPSRVFGLAHTNVVRASTAAARAMHMDPRGVVVPVIGGHSPLTMVPVFSHTKPCCLPKKAQTSLACRLTEAVKTSGMDVVRAKAYKGSSNLCTAHATGQFVNSLAKAMLGYPSIAECAYVRSHIIPECKYLVTPIELGEYGIKYNYGLPELNEYERQQMIPSIYNLRNDIALGEWYFRSRYVLQC